MGVLALVLNKNVFVNLTRLNDPNVCSFKRKSFPFRRLFKMLSHESIEISCRLILWFNFFYNTLSLLEDRPEGRMLNAEQEPIIPQLRGTP